MESSITRVRVFRQGATVTRTVELPEDTPDHIEITGLPLSLVDGTVRVRIRGAVRAGAPHVGLFARAPEDTPEPPDEVALREAQQAVANTRLRLETLRGQVEALEGIAVPARPRPVDGEAPAPSPMATRLALERFTDAAIDARLERIRALEATLVEQREVERHLMHQVVQSGRSDHVDTRTLTKAVRIPLRGTGGGTLELDYHVPDARWSPTYRCHVDTATGAVRIEQRAMVIQASGEDWRRTLLELSTAAPLRHTALPELHALRIGKRQPPPKVRGFRPAPVGAEALFADFDRRPVAGKSRRKKPTGWEPLGRPFGVFDFALAPISEDDLDVLGEEEAPLPPPAAEPFVRSAPMPAPALKAKKASRARARRMPGRQEAALAPPEEPAAIASPPGFTDLQLAKPTSPQRGKLEASDRLDAYRRSLKSRGLRLQTDLATLLSQAEGKAHAALTAKLPPGAIDLRRHDGAFAYTYTTDHAVDVPSSPTFHSLPVTVDDAKAHVRYVVVPREDANVFRVADIHHPSPRPLLGGPVEVYVDGTYTLSGTLPLVPPNGRFQLGLGVEQAVRCARNTTFREARSSEAVVAMNELHHTITVTLHNQLGRPIQAEVRERLPTPDAEAEVAVEEVAIEPPWEPWDQREVGGREVVGGHRWTLDLQAGERKDLEAHYVVKIYANNELVGGNRREA